MQIIERKTETRAFIDAPANKVIEILESIPAADEPAGLVPAVLFVIIEHDADQDTTIGTAGNLAGALACAASHVARLLVGTLTEAELESAARALDNHAGEREKTRASLAALLTKNTGGIVH
jgi:hypothetical protein